MAWRVLYESPYYGTGNKQYVEAVCVSTDTKATTNLVAGSRCVEIDTGDVYLFDETTWVKQFSLQG